MIYPIITFILAGIVAFMAFSAGALPLT